MKVPRIPVFVTPNGRRDEELDEDLFIPEWEEQQLRKAHRMFIAESIKDRSVKKHYPGGQDHDQSKHGNRSKSNGARGVPKDKKHHATRTYRGRPACAGSREVAIKVGSTKYSGDRYACVTCGRTDVSTGFGDKPARMGTHLHVDDLVSRRSTSTAATPLAEDEEWVPTAEQHEAIKAFTVDPSKESYEALLASGLDGGRNPRHSYVAYARKQGWMK